MLNGDVKPYRASLAPPSAVPTSRTGLTAGVKLDFKLMINKEVFTSPHGASLAGAAEGGIPGLPSETKPFCDIPAPHLPEW